MNRYPENTSTIKGKQFSLLNKILIFEPKFAKIDVYHEKGSCAWHVQNVYKGEKHNA